MYNPGYFKIDKRKIKDLIELLKLEKDDIKSLKKNLKKTKSTLKLGDMQPAKVISLNPLLITSYSDEFDGVLIYNYPTELGLKYNLKENQPLVSSNSYWPKESFDIEEDIIPGRDCSNVWRDVISFIPLFLCLEQQENSCYYYAENLFDKEIWNRLDVLTEEYLKEKHNYTRNGLKTLIKY